MTLVVGKVVQFSLHLLRQLVVFKSHVIIRLKRVTSDNIVICVHTSTRKKNNFTPHTFGQHSTRNCSYLRKPVTSDHIYYGNRKLQVTHFLMKSVTSGHRREPVT